MVEIYWTATAAESIKNIAAFIAKDSVYYAEKQVQKFFHSVEVLQHHPEIGKPVTEYNRTDIRELLVGRYRIIYKLKTSTQIDILTVHHSARLLHLDVE